MENQLERAKAFILYQTLTLTLTPSDERLGKYLGKGNGQGKDREGGWGRIE